MATLFSRMHQVFFARPNRLTFPAAAVLLLFALAVFLPGFFTLPVIDRDEARFAQASKQMVESGDYINIRIGNEARNKKPAGIHWLQAGSLQAAKLLTGEKENTNIWIYRLPSLLGALMAVLLTAAIGCKLFNSETGFIAGALLASCLLLNVEARLATTDAALLASLCGCMFVLAKAFQQQKPLKLRDFFLFWLALAAGFLIKGPVILLGPLAALLTLKFVFKEDVAFAKKLRPWLGLPLALALIVPWFVLISLSTRGAYLQESAGHDLFAKLWEGQNWGFGIPGLHAIALPVTFWPASLPFLLAIPFIWASRHDRPFRFCLAAILPVWLIFELTSTKLPHYILPAFPAMAVLTAVWLTSGLRESGAKGWSVFVSIVIALVSFGMAMLGAVLPPLLEGTLFYGALFCGALALGAIIAAALLLRKQQLMLAAAPLPLAGFAMMLALFGFTLPQLSHVFMSKAIMENLPEMAGCEKPLLLTAGYNEDSLVFLAGKETQMLNDAERVAEMLKQQPCAVAVVEDDQKFRLQKSAASAGMTLEMTAHLDGFNYGNGHAAHLGIYRKGP